MIEIIKSKVYIKHNRSKILFEIMALLLGISTCIYQITAHTQPQFQDAALYEAQAGMDYCWI